MLLRSEVKDINLWRYSGNLAGIQFVSETNIIRRSKFSPFGAYCQEAMACSEIGPEYCPTNSHHALSGPVSCLLFQIELRDEIYRHLEPYPHLKNYRESVLRNIPDNAFMA